MRNMRNVETALRINLRPDFYSGSSNTRYRNNSIDLGLPKATTSAEIWTMPSIRSALNLNFQTSYQTRKKHCLIEA
jgi:hypothetical protein